MVKFPALISRVVPIPLRPTARVLPEDIVSGPVLLKEPEKTDRPATEPTTDTLSPPYRSRKPSLLIVIVPEFESVPARPLSTIIVPRALFVMEPSLIMEPPSASIKPLFVSESSLVNVQ